MRLPDRAFLRAENPDDILVGGKFMLDGLQPLDGARLGRAHQDAVLKIPQQRADDNSFLADGGLAAGAERLDHDLRLRAVETVDQRAVIVRGFQGVSVCEQHLMRKPPVGVQRIDDTGMFAGGGVRVSHCAAAMHSFRNLP